MASLSLEKMPPPRVCSANHSVIGEACISNTRLTSCTPERLPVNLQAGCLLSGMRPIDYSPCSWGASDFPAFWSHYLLRIWPPGQLQLVGRRSCQLNGVETTAREEDRFFFLPSLYFGTLRSGLVGLLETKLMYLLQNCQKYLVYLMYHQS